MRSLISLAVILLVPLTAYAQVGLPTPDPADFDADRVANVALADYPVMPTWAQTAVDIYAYGQQLGRDPAVFAKVGDSMTASAEFLAPAAAPNAVLGEYGELQAVLDHFAPDAFTRQSDAATEGLMTISALDPFWAAENCEPNETPLACEYRQTNAAFALIMFGTNDVMVIDAPTFDLYLRTVVTQTANAGVVPVLSTFPPRPEDVEKSLTFNRVVVTIAEDYDLPLVNLLAALEPLPDYGVDPNDTLHLTTPVPPATTGTFTEDALMAGYTVRNLVVMRALHALLQQQQQNESVEAATS